MGWAGETIVFTWRFVSGAPLDGERRTDAGWRRPGTAVVHPSGQAWSWHYRPRLHRAGYRVGLGSAVVGELYGLAVAPELTMGATSAAAAGVLVYGGNRVRRRWLARQHRREVVLPLLESLSGPLGLPFGARAETWLTVPERPHRVGQITRITIPDHWSAEDYQQAQIQRLVTKWVGDSGGSGSLAPHE